MNKNLLAPLYRMNKSFLNIQELGLVPFFPASQPLPLVNRISRSFKNTQRTRTSSEKLDRKEHICLTRSDSNFSNLDFFYFKSLFFSYLLNLC